HRDGITLLRSHQRCSSGTQSIQPALLPLLLPPVHHPIPAAHPRKRSCKCAAAGCTLCAHDQVSTSTALSSTELHGCAQNERRMTPCEKSKFTTMRGSCWKHMVPRPLQKPLRTPSNSRQNAWSNWPKPGD